MDDDDIDVFSPPLCTLTTISAVGDMLRALSRSKRVCCPFPSHVCACSPVRRSMPQSGISNVLPTYQQSLVPFSVSPLVRGLLISVPRSRR